MRAIACVLTAALLCACTSTHGGQAVSAPSTYPAPPAGVFPDFTHFATADIAKYTETNAHHDTVVAFAAPGGVACSASIYGQATGGDGLGLVECTGANMPGFPANAAGQDVRPYPGKSRGETVRQKSDGSFEFTYTAGDSQNDAAPPLPAGQKLVVNDSGCGAGDEFVACYTADHHGFVVSPTGSWGF
jgi:hypothetical protein